LGSTKERKNPPRGNAPPAAPTPGERKAEEKLVSFENEKKWKKKNRSSKGREGELRGARSEEKQNWVLRGAKGRENKGTRLEFASKKG